MRLSASREAGSSVRSTRCPLRARANWRPRAGTSSASAAERDMKIGSKGERKRDRHEEEAHVEGREDAQLRERRARLEAGERKDARAAAGQAPLRGRQLARNEAG